MSTVHVNPTYRQRLPGKTVVLLDDFTTQGTSLQWSRNLLKTAGAARVILVTVGKYGRSRPPFHNSFMPKPGVELDAFDVSSRSFDDVFRSNWTQFVENESAASLLSDSFTHVAMGKALPVRV